MNINLRVILIGITALVAGAYLQLFFPGLQVAPIAAGFAIFFGILNFFGAKKSGSFQVLLLVGLLILLLWFCGFGLLQVEVSRFSGFFESGSAGIVSTAGLVIVSYMGLTQVASIAEPARLLNKQVADAERATPSSSSRNSAVTTAATSVL